MKLPQIGELLEGKYRIEQVLGEGGFGRVVLATTLKTGRPVAIKFLKPTKQGYTTQQVQRFLREMRATAKLQCPSTLTLFDYGRTDDGLLYMVCEYIEGEDLLQRIVARGRLPEHEVVWVLYQVLQSLAEAHDAGVLHRDIKPANIRLYRYGNDPLRVKVLDFGLAKSLEPGEASLTRTGKVIGTPRYMSPDQLIGLELTPASDIFSVGVVAVEMLLGRQASAITDGRRRLHLRPEDGVSPGLAAVVNRMTEADPDARYQRAADVLRDLKPLRAPGQRPDRDAAAAPELPPTVAEPGRDPLVEPRRSGRTIVLFAAALLGVVLVAVAVQRDDPEPITPRTRRAVPSLIEVESAPSVVPPARPKADIGVVDLAASACSQREPGWFTLRDDEPLGWEVYVPRSYTGKQEVPLVLLLADSLNSRARFIAEAGFVEPADREGFVVVAPKFRSPGDSGVWDEMVRPRYVRKVIEELRDEVCIAADSVYVYGDGEGARKLRWFGCEPWVAAIVTHHDRPRRVECPDRQVPHLHHSPLDSEFIRLDGKRPCTNLVSNTRSIEKFERWWTRHNGCDAKPREVKWNPSLTCYEYQNCDEPFVSCRTPGGYGWPDSKIRWMQKTLCPSDPEPVDFNAPDVAWHFFADAAPLSGQAE